MEGCWDAFVSTPAGPAFLFFSRLVEEVGSSGVPIKAWVLVMHLGSAQGQPH